MHQDGAKQSGARPSRSRRNQNNKLVNYDGSAALLGQAQDNAMFGSTGAGLQMQPAVSSGVQEAVADIIGTTPEGRAWAIAALHPCGAGEVTARNVGTVMGMCDTMTSSVATPTYRAETHVTYSPALFVEPPTAPTTYGIDIIIPPIPEVDFCYRLIDDSTNAKTQWIVVRQPDFDLPSPVTYPVGGGNGYTESTVFTCMNNVGYGKVRRIATGHTIELDAAGLNNQGRVVVGQMEGQWNWLPLTSGSIVSTSKPFVTDVGPPAVIDYALTSVAARSSPDVNGVWYLRVPTDPSVVTANCPNAYQGLAKHGAYVVSKFTSPLLGYAFKRTGQEGVFKTSQSESAATKPYLPASSFAIGDSAGGEALAMANQFWNLDSTARQWSAFGNKATPINDDAGFELAQGLFHPGVSEPSDMMTAVVMFRNLPAGGSMGTTASLRVKSRNFLEAISNGSNPAVAPYIHPPAPFDFPALNSVIIAGKKLGDAYPASANSLGSIFGKIWGAIKNVVKPISKVVGGIGLPMVSPIANFVHDSIVRGEDLQNDLQ